MNNERFLFFLIILFAMVGCGPLGIKEKTFTLTIEYYDGKELLSSKEMTIPEGEDISFPINPDSGYIARRIYDNGVGTPVVEIFSIKNIDSDHLIKIECEKILPTFTVTISQKGIGTVSPSGVVNVTYGEYLPISISTNEENLIDSIFVNGVYIAPIDTLKLYSIKKKYDVVVVFRAKKVFTIDISSGEGSKPNPNGLVKVLEGSSITIDNILKYGWSMDKFLLEGKEVSPIDRYTFSNIKEDHTIRWENKKEPEWYLTHITWYRDSMYVSNRIYYIPNSEILNFSSDGKYTCFWNGELYYRTWTLNKNVNPIILKCGYGNCILEILNREKMILSYLSPEADGSIAKTTMVYHGVLKE